LNIAPAAGSAAGFFLLAVRMDRPAPGNNKTEI
jgi:hypothetical protein